MQCVFDNPVHANGGCIFANPSEFIVDVVAELLPGGGGKSTHRRPGYRTNLDLARREDEEIMMIVQAWLMTRK